MFDISVVIPTFNRAPNLSSCLASLCEQSISSSRFEICVVNNNSNDNTPQIVVEAIKKYPEHNIFLVDEPAIGVANARNTGVHETSAPLIAMGDDDATMPADWLERYLALFASLGESVGKIGGEITPVWNAPRPDWITDNMLPFVSAASGLESTPHFTDKPLLEGNGCYRREALMEAGGFPSQVGRNGKYLLSGEHVVDIIMFLKGWKLYHDPGIIIHHTIHADRLTPEWFRRRYFWQGVSDCFSRFYLQSKGININYAVEANLPLNLSDWSFVNDNSTPPTEDHLKKFHSLGLVSAMGGIIPKG
jgi:glycosyltransferase involved in cell wall biosynthesis